MKSFTSVAPDAVTVYMAGRYVAGTHPATDHVIEAIRKYGKWVVLAAAAVIQNKPADFEDIPADEIMEFLEEHYLYAGATVGSALKGYAEDDLNSGLNGELGRLYDALDKAGGVDRFDWGLYAFDDMTPTIGMHFVEMPVPTGEDGVFVFGT